MNDNPMKDDSYGMIGMMPCPVQMNKYSMVYQLEQNKYVNEPITNLYWKMNNTFPGASALRINNPNQTEGWTTIKGINLTE
jgi:hypothetical protein